MQEPKVINYPDAACWHSPGQREGRVPRASRPQKRPAISASAIGLFLGSTSTNPMPVYSTLHWFAFASVLKNAGKGITVICVPQDAGTVCCASTCVRILLQDRVLPWKPHIQLSKNPTSSLYNGTRKIPWKGGCGQFLCRLKAAVSLAELLMRLRNALV